MTGPAIGGTTGPRDSLQRRILLAGIVCLAAAIADGFRVPEQFFRSYLLAFIFWIGFPLGCGSVLMMHYLTGGNWGLLVKRPLEAGIAILPLFSLAGLPLLFGMRYLFPWAPGTSAPAEPGMIGGSPYLNVPFFMVRQAVYVAIWVFLAMRLKVLSQRVDSAGDAVALERLERLSGPGLVVYVLTVTFFAIDWVMSLQPDWNSTIFGLLFVAEQAQAGFSLAIVVAWATGRPGDMAPRETLNDLGSLQMTFVMLWAYLAFSQFLIIWSGNLVGDISWYVFRARGYWGLLALSLIVLSFAVPFVLLLMRSIKQRIGLLAAISGGLIVMNFVYVFWTIVPSFLPEAPRLYLLDALLVAGLGCLFCAAFAQELRREPLVPVADPRFHEVLEHAE